MDNYVDGVRPYTISSHDIWEINGEGKKNCLKLDWNEATIFPSPKVCNRLKELANKADFYQWYPNTQNSILISHIAEYMKVGKENVQVFASSDTLQEYIARCWLNSGDKVLIIWPTYDNFRATVEGAGARIVYSIMDNLEFNFDQIQNAIEENNPKMVYICNPNNPTGEQICIAIIEQLVKTNKEVLFLIDEAYAEFSGETAADLVHKYNNLLISRTFSKAFALANFRIGYLISSEENIVVISRVRNSKNITTFSQEAAIAALEDLEYMEEYVKEVKYARDYFVDKVHAISGINVFTSKTNFVLVKLRNHRIKMLFLDFMKKNNIYIRDLQQDVLLECYVRITIGTKEQMEIVVDKMRQFEALDYEGSNI